MTSVLNVDTIADKAGTGPVGLTKQSAAKMWCNMNGTGTIAINGSFNVSSLDDNGTGLYDMNYTNSMSDGNYSGQVNIQNASPQLQTTNASYLYVQSKDASGTLVDSLVWASNNGDLA